MKYTLVLTSQATEQLRLWRESGQAKTCLRIYRLLQEMEEHPRTGTGQVERLRGNLSGYWSRRIDKANRIVYSIEDEIVTVTVISLSGHYK